MTEASCMVHAGVFPAPQVQEAEPSLLWQTGSTTTPKAVVLLLQPYAQPHFTAFLMQCT